MYFYYCYSIPRWCLVLCNPHIKYPNECHIRSDRSSFLTVIIQSSSFIPHSVSGSILTMSALEVKRSFKLNGRPLRGLGSAAERGLPSKARNLIQISRIKLGYTSFSCRTWSRYDMVEWILGCINQTPGFWLIPPEVSISFWTCPEFWNIRQGLSDDRCLVEAILDRRWTPPRPDWAGKWLPLTSLYWRTEIGTRTSPGVLPHIAVITRRLLVFVRRMGMVGVQSREKEEEEEEKERGKWEKGDHSAFAWIWTNFIIFSRSPFSPPFSWPFLFRVNEVAWAMVGREKNATPKRNLKGEDEGVGGLERE